MLTEKQKKAIDTLRYRPVQVAYWLGFNKLTELHNEWMCEFINGTEDYTLQAHRGSYKSTCISIALAIKMVLRPNKDIIFCRKTDTDVAEIVGQVANILQSDVMQHFAMIIYGRRIALIDCNKSQITTDLRTTTKGSVQLLGIGIGGSITGKHADEIFTDDIINIKDRLSNAERTHTKQFYMELQNVKNRGGRIVNTGTPWHKEDAFSIMPKAKQYDCYLTGLMTDDDIKHLRASMSNSLFSANYELKHIADEDALFKGEPKFFDDISMLYNGIGHIDASYGGADSSAFSVAKKVNGCYYIYGLKRDRHIDDCLDEFLAVVDQTKCGTIYCEDNADKGYLKKEIKQKGYISDNYHESTNKFYKISTFLKNAWNNIYWYKDTDSDYLLQILDYTEQAEHDDCPDSASSIIRKLDNRLIIG